MFIFTVSEMRSGETTLFPWHFMSDSVRGVELFIRVASCLLAHEDDLGIILVTFVKELNF